ncbi:ArsR family transcriptional regulator [Shewanella algae]|uniref:VpaChn25_0724 family phage protein n=1 Tax=Shewanella algae TaxID=38313 RepID=UPI000F42BE3A|nr:ArsR family transcriptional regulator [Shewanella algae]AYV12978.1 ArsR family transcriptional regulator [Shewanella algae]
MPIADLMAEHQRLVVLRLLTEVPGFELNESILQDGLDAYGLGISRDALRTQLAWLNEQGLIATNQIGSVTMARLTGRGEDVANGRASVPGVKRPRAGE